MSAKPSIALCHPWLGLGGSEATAMWSIAALRREYSITLITASEVDLGKLNAAYGTDVEAGDFHLLRAPALPAVQNPARLAHWRVKRFEQFCRHNIGDRDVPVSAYNPIDFGRPGLHIVGDFSWDEETRLELFGEATGHGALRRGYLWLGSRLFGASGRDILDGHDLVAANSEWSAAVLAERFGLRGAPILYPPVHVEVSATEPTRRGAAHFVCLGRISPEKRIERTIAVLERVRAAGHPDVHLTVVGEIGNDAYGQQIAALAAERGDWIETPGYVGGAAKFELLASHPFAINSCDGEAFGIAVAEMLLCGCVPFVHRTGGAAEIVGTDDLRFGDEVEAAEKIARALDDPNHAAKLRNQLIASGDRFAPEAFEAGIRELVARFLASQQRRHAA